MISLFSRPAIARVLSLALLAAGAADAIAQTQNRPRTTPNTNRPATTVRPATQGGGGGGGSNAGVNRQYTNSTLIGDALITSDLETRRLIVVTDEDTNENIRTIIASLDKPKPQVLINVVFVQVSHDKGMDLGAEVSYAGSIGLNVV